MRADGTAQLLGVMGQLNDSRFTIRKRSRRSNSPGARIR